MSFTRFRVLFFIFAFVACSGGSTDYDENYFAYNNTETENEVSEKSFSWLNSAKNMFSSPAGHVAVQVAKELLNRSTGNSQVRSEVVLSLNLSNLLIILLLKILIFTAGVLGAGHWGGGYGGYGHNYARSAARSESSLNFGLSNGEDYLITGFLAAQGAGIDDCLYSAACANPQVASEYAKAAKALMEGIEKFEGMRFNNPRYNDLVTLVEKAANEGQRGSNCSTTRHCDTLL